MRAGKWAAARRDLSKLKREFSKSRLVVIPEFLEPTFAERIYDAIGSLDERFWYQYRFGEKQKAPDGEDWALGRYLTYNVTAQNRNMLVRRKLEFASPADELGRNHPFIRLRTAMNSNEIQSFVEDVTSMAFTPRSCLFSVNRMRPGDSIGNHTDGTFPRRLAFVLYLTKKWKKDWGGNFYGKKSPAAIIPGFNSLLLFEVPAWHRVSRLTKRAGERKAVAGWFHDFSISQLQTYVTTTGEIPPLIRRMT